MKLLYHKHKNIKLSIMLIILLLFLLSLLLLLLITLMFLHFNVIFSLFQYQKMKFYFDSQHLCPVSRGIPVNTLAASLHS